MDQPVCGHLDYHSPVACSDHVHAPEGHPAFNQDHPQVRHVPGKRAGGALNTHETDTCTQTAVYTPYA